MGTDDPTLDLVAGDRVEVEIDGIGTLANTLVPEQAVALG
jgi:2-keto-4-pentenoate hydratase/2-oxohepta-3-ene-1,7-dioic acid hydratase in catechol pathway